MKKSCDANRWRQSTDQKLRYPALRTPVWGTAKQETGSFLWRNGIAPPQASSPKDLRIQTLPGSSMIHPGSQLVTLQCNLPLESQPCTQSFQPVFKALLLNVNEPKDIYLRQTANKQEKGLKELEILQEAKQNFNPLPSKLEHSHREKS